MCIQCIHLKEKIAEATREIENVKVVLLFFERSNKTKRTPTRKRTGNTEEMEQLKGMFKELMSEVEVKEIRQDQKENKEDMKELKNEIKELRAEQRKNKEEIEALKLEIKNMHGKMDSLESFTLALKNRLEILDKISRKNKIIMTGLIIDTDDRDGLKAPPKT